MNSDRTIPLGDLAGWGDPRAGDRRREQRRSRLSVRAVRSDAIEMIDPIRDGGRHRRHPARGLRHLLRLPGGALAPPAHQQPDRVRLLRGPAAHQRRPADVGPGEQPLPGLQAGDAAEHQLAGDQWPQPAVAPARRLALRRRQAPTSVGNGGCCRIAHLTDLLEGFSTSLDNSSRSSSPATRSVPLRPGWWARETPAACG